MSYLLDTNVISEWRRPRPDEGLVQWLRGTDEDELYISAATVAEISYGVERMPRGRRRDEIGDWLDRGIVGRFGERIVDIDRRAAALWGRIVAGRAAAGEPIGIMDAFVAAAALARGFALVTRNDHDFRGLGLRLVNPWKR
jgi:hypothetical protein